MSSLLSKASVLLQYLLPRYLLTSLAYQLSRVRNVPIKNFLIERFVSMYKIDTEEFDQAVPDDFRTFNDFFTRTLRVDVRPIDPDPSILVSPSDGKVSAAGQIARRQIFQAKGKDYSLRDLLATNLREADEFVDGLFATIYLAPHNYHRVHAPLDGELLGLHYVPGDLFSVNAATVDGVPQLFCRNERLICHFATAAGPLALIFVGALNVGSITTPWTGELRPTRRGVGEALSLPDAVPSRVSKGDLLGWFNMGSTVILLLPPGAVSWQDTFAAGSSCRMGQAIGTTRPAA